LDHGSAFARNAASWVQHRQALHWLQELMRDEDFAGHRGPIRKGRVD